MPYTAETLAAYMHSQLRATAAVLGWTSPASYVAPVTEAVKAYGVETIDLATNQRRLELLANVEAWRAVVAETAGDTDYDSGDTAIKRSQIHAQAKGMFGLALAALGEYDAAQRAAAGDMGASYTVRARGVW